MNLKLKGITVIHAGVNHRSGVELVDYIVLIIARLQIYRDALRGARNSRRRRMVERTQREPVLWIDAVMRQDVLISAGECLAFRMHSTRFGTHDYIDAATGSRVL